MKKIDFFRFFLIVVPVFLFICRSDELAAQKSDSDSLKSFRLFEDEEILNITLRFDLQTYFRSKPQKEYLKANMTIHLSETDSVNRDIRLRTRGIFRNQYCMFPPIELNFKKIDFGYSDLNNISKLKMVVQCASGKDKEDYILREYLAYKLFSVMTDTSLRVRLVSVTYIDTERKRKPMKQYAFFIEPVDMLVERTNCIQLKTKTLNQKHIVPSVMDRMAIFNYMIGNYDWSVPGPHNVILTKSLNIDPQGLGIAIPYDFDWSGLVNPTYAVPAENVGTENVRVRYFQGVCRDKKVFDKQLVYFLELKPQFYNVINEFTYIDQRVKKDITGYLDGFFDQVSGRRDLILSSLMNSCKNF